MKKCFNKFVSMVQKAKTVLIEKKAEGFVDSGVKILISVVVGAVILVGIYTLYEHTIIPVTDFKISELFNYAG